MIYAYPTFHRGIEDALAGLGDQPQTSRATCTMSSSLARCWSWVRTLPSTVEEKPHWPDRQSWSSGTYLAAWSIRRLSRSGSCRAPGLGGDQAEYDHLAGRDEPQRLEVPGAGVVVFHEEAVHRQLAEQGLGDEVVAAGRRPRRSGSCPGTGEW